MPPPLRVAYWGSCALTALGWLCVVVVIRGSADLPLVLPVGALLLPVSAAFALGFSECQTWTRPLAVIVPAVAGALAALGGASWVALVLLATSAGVAIYLYLGAAPRAYYRALRDQAVVRLSATDLLDPSFIPLYCGAAGLAAGALLAHRLVTWHFGYASGLGANEMAGLVLAMVMGGVALAVLGFWVASAIVSKRHRAA